MTHHPGQILDCIGRGNLTENQMMGMIQKIKREGLLQQEPPECHGKGIVIAGGGKYLDWAWVVCKWLRGLGCQLPIQVWYLGAKEMPERAKPLFAELGVETVDTLEERQWKPMRRIGGWEMKPYCVMNAPWRHVMFLDADCFPEFNPEEMFNHQEIQRHGSLFFSDVARHHRSEWGYVYCGLFRKEKEWESGQFIVDKQRAWMGLRWTFWFCEHSDVWFKLGHGEKLLFELGFRTAQCPHLVSADARWEHYGIGQYWEGKRWFCHAMGYKRREAPAPHPQIAGLFLDWKEVYEGRREPMDFAI